MVQKFRITRQLTLVKMLTYLLIKHYGHRIGESSNSLYLNSYLADVHMVDGQALAATDFGAPDDNGVWQPKKFEGTYNNGHLLSNYGVN